MLAWSLCLITTDFSKAMVIGLRYEDSFLVGFKALAPIMPGRARIAKRRLRLLVEPDVLLAMGEVEMDGVETTTRWKLCLALLVGFLGVCFAGKADLAMMEEELCNNVLVFTIAKL